LFWLNFLLLNLKVVTFLIYNMKQAKPTDAAKPTDSALDQHKEQQFYQHIEQQFSTSTTRTVVDIK
jgi:hypothetical protein